MSKKSIKDKIENSLLFAALLGAGAGLSWVASGSALTWFNNSEKKTQKVITKKNNYDNNKSVSKVLQTIFAIAKKEAKSAELMQKLTSSEKACDDIYDMFDCCHDRVEFARTIRFLLEPLKEVNNRYYNVAYEVASAAYKTYAAEMYSKTFDREYDQAASYMSLGEAQGKLNAAIMKAKPFIAYKKVATVFVFNANKQYIEKTK